MFFKAIETANLNYVKELIQNGFDTDVINESGETVLGFACQIGNLEIVKELITNDADVNIKDSSGETPLMLASEYGHVEIVKYLLEHGAKVHKKDCEGNTALMKATGKEYSHLEIVKELIKNGADVNKRNKDKETALLRVMLRYTKSEKMASENILEDIVEELIKNGADVNMENEDATPLMLAAGAGNLKLVKRFLELGADVNVRDYEGNSALTFSIGHEEFGERPINIDVVKELIRNGADVNVKEKSHKCTPLMSQFDLKKEGENQEVIKVLIKNGADIVYLFKRLDKDPFCHFKSKEVFKSVVKQQVQDNDYEVLAKWVNAYYTYLGISHKSKYTNIYKNSLEKLDKKKLFVEKLFNNKVILEHKKELQEVKKCFESLTYCKNQDELYKTILNMPQNITSKYAKIANLDLDTNTDILEIADKLQKNLKLTVEKGEKLFDTIQKSKDIITLYHNQLILNAIIAGKKNKANKLNNITKKNKTVKLKKSKRKHKDKLDDIQAKKSKKDVGFQQKFRLFLDDIQSKEAKKKHKHKHTINSVQLENMAQINAIMTRNRNNTNNMELS